MAGTRLIHLPFFGYRIQVAELVFLALAASIFYHRDRGTFQWQVLDYISWALIAAFLIAAYPFQDNMVILEVLALCYLYLVSCFFRFSKLPRSFFRNCLFVLGGITAISGTIGWLLNLGGFETILAWSTSTYYPYLGYIGRAMGFTGHPNMMMSLLAFCGIFLFAHALVAKEKKLVTRVVLGMIALGALLTFSKALVLLAICLIWIWMKTQKAEGVKRWVFNFSMIGLLGFYLFVTHIMVIQPKQVDWTALQSRAYTLDHTFYQHDNLGLIWTNYAVNKRTAFNAFLDHPFWGIGPGQYGEFVGRLKEENRYPTYFPNYDPHCNLLGFLAETGAFATLILLLVFWILYQDWKSWTTNTSEQEATKIAFAALFIFFLLEGINTDNLHFRHYWVALGLFLAQKNIHRTQAKDASII